MRRWFWLTLAALAGPGQLVEAQGPAVYRITVSGVIENGLAPYVARSLREAEA
jgi:membrane-bound ClpP family serine protease